MGGAGYNRSEKGTKIQRISRDVRVKVVGGGVEELLAELALNQEVGTLE